MRQGAGRGRLAPVAAVLLLPLVAAAPGRRPLPNHPPPTRPRLSRASLNRPLPIPPLPDPAVAAREALRQAERDRAAQLARHEAASLRAAGAQADQQRFSGALIEETARLQATEQALATAADRMDALRRRQAVAEAALAARAAALAPLLPLIERLALHPAETLLAVPAPPAETLAGVLVIRGLSARLEQDAEALRREQRTVASLAEEIAAAARQLAVAGAEQRAEAATLDARIAVAREAEQTARDAAATAARAAAADAGRAGDLRGLLRRIEADRRAAETAAQADAARAARRERPAAAAAPKARAVAFAVPGAPRIAAAAGHAPVAGRLVRAFGAATDAGPAEGLTYATPPGARVVSPCAGQVEFAAPFRGYGRLLIVDCGGGYHLVLAGLDRLDVSVGHPVQVGSPMGVMPGGNAGVGGRRPSLYVELRRDGQPVDPAPWLRAKD